MIGEKNKLKFEPRQKSNGKYGVWNNDMYSWQYIPVLDAYETETYRQAERYADAMNLLLTQ